MIRRVKGHRLLLGLGAVLVVVSGCGDDGNEGKLVPGPKKPPMEIASTGADQAVARHPLEVELKHLFQGSNGSWQVLRAATFADASQCRVPAAPRPSGGAITATYLFARWLEFDMQSLAYTTPALAQRTLAFFDRHELACIARVAVADFRRRGAQAGPPEAFVLTRPSIDEEAVTGLYEIPQNYHGRLYRWHLANTAIRRGRMIVTAVTVTTGPFVKADQGLASDLAMAAGTGR